MNHVIETINLSGGTAFGNDIVNLILQSGPVAKSVLILLMLFSLGSWGIMLDKWLQFRRLFKSSEKFFKIFKNTDGFEDLLRRLKPLGSIPLSRIFTTALRTLQKRHPDWGTRTITLKPSDLRAIESAIDDAILIETEELTKRLSFLGTCGGVTPFIGLFGTVWGIMNAFRGIGMAGSASIAAVAPGIAEALVTTAAGLATAVPAVIGYNYFLAQIRKSSNLFERFRFNFLGTLE